MYDAIVVGARCAGSPTAMLLARKGHRVLVVDRASFPSDTISTHYIHQPGIARLKSWGLLDKVRASNCPALMRMRFDVGAFAIAGSPVPAGDVSEAYCPRRTVLDKILVDAAAASGAEVRERYLVEEVLFEDGRVAGVRGRAQNGASGVERARVVVGADGLHSLVARAVAAPDYAAKPKVSCGYYTYWSGVPMEGVEIYAREGRAIFALPTNDGLTLVFVVWPQEDFASFRANVEANYLETLELAPGLADRVRAGRRAERFNGTADLPNFFRKPYGPGWALVGDAGYHKDPQTAQGISDAFRDAELLAAALDDGLSGRREMDETLAGYERLRNEAAMPMYEFTWQLARLRPPTPEQVALFSALRDQPGEARQFFGVLAGTVPIPEFYAPENIASIVEGAARAAGGTAQ